MLGDESDTPREHVVTEAERREHFKTYPPGALVVGESSPVTARSPFEINLHERVKSLEDSRSFWKWAAGIGVPLLFALAGAILRDNMAEIAKSSERVGATAAKIEALEQRMGSDRASLEQMLRLLDEDIRDLRKHAGLDPKPISVVNAP